MTTLGGGTECGKVTEKMEGRAAVLQLILAPPAEFFFFLEGWWETREYIISLKTSGVQ